MKNLIYMWTISASDKLAVFSYCKLLTGYISPPYPNFMTPEMLWNLYWMLTLMEIQMAQKHSNNTFSLPDCWQHMGWYSSNQSSGIKTSKWKPGFLPQGFCYFLSPPCPLSSLCTLSSISLTSQPAAELSMARLNLLECLDYSCLSTAPAGFPWWELPPPCAPATAGQRGRNNFKICPQDAALSWHPADN